MKLTNPKHIFGLLCVINVLNYIDRGIIPGAPIQFQAFVQQTLQVPPENASVYIGILVSSFIAAYSIFICVFGYLSIRHRPFLLAAVGLFIWIISIAISGLAKPFNSYYLLLVGRLVSGIGESSFQAITPSFIDQHAPPSKRTLWMGIFGCAISAGTALGYSYGSLTAQSIGWDWGLFITAMVMIPLAMLCYTAIPSEFDIPMAHERNSEEMSRMSVAPANFLTELWGVLQSPLFLTATFGWAAYSFTIAGLGSFGPAILIGSSILDEKICSTVFGGMVVLAGMLGSPLGGYAVDYQCRGSETDSARRLLVVTRQMFVLITSGITLAFVSVCFIDIPFAFLLFLFLALILLFMTQSAFTVCILLSVSRARQGFATGLSTFLLHLLGDVPSPIILGWLKDMWAPDCGSIFDDEQREKLNPNCIKTGKPGLKNLLFFAYSWLALTSLFWGLSLLIAKRRVWEQNKRGMFDTITPMIETL